jgi:hypothetical protein
MTYKKFFAYSLFFLVSTYLLIVLFTPDFFNFFIIVLSLLLYLALHVGFAVLYLILNYSGHSRKETILNLFSYLSFALIMLSGIALIIYGRIK